MKVVLDTNVLVSALIVKVGKPAQILRQAGAFEWLTREYLFSRQQPFSRCCETADGGAVSETPVVSSSSS
jgi:hypothetical protein